MRKIALALALILCSLTSPAGFLVTPGWAQAPPPVPAEPDTERRTRYSGVSSVTTFNVGFDVYGDGTDYANWVEVWVNGVQVSASGNWSMVPVSGSFTTLSRPLLAANLNIVFTTAKSGTIDIVGARRPRRTSQLAENRGVTARDFNQLTTDLWMTARERWDRTSRTIMAPPGETLSNLPPAATRANGALGFNSSGDLIVNAGALSGATVSAAMVPVVQAATLTIARSTLGTNDAANLTTGLVPLAQIPCGIDSNQLSTKAADYSIIAADCGKTTVFTGISWTVTLPAPGTISGSFPSFTTRVCNGNANDISHHAMRLSGFPSGVMARLYMGQCVGVKIENGAWIATEVPGRFKPTFTPTLYVDNGGSNTNDGLISNASTNALLTMQQCIVILQQEYDLGGQQPICSPTGGQTLVGSFAQTGMGVGGSVFSIIGNGGVAILRPTPATTFVMMMSDFAGYVITTNVTFDCTGGAATCYDVFFHQEGGADFNGGTTFVGNGLGHTAFACDSLCKVNVNSDASTAITISGTFGIAFSGTLGSKIVFSNGLTVAASTSVGTALFQVQLGSTLQFTGALNGGAGTSLAAADVFQVRSKSQVCLTSTYSNSWTVAPNRKFSALNGGILMNTSANAIVGTNAGIVTSSGFAPGFAPDNAATNTGVNAAGC